VHRKKRKKNVPTADAQTQTERSDYMRIKQRQMQLKKHQEMAEQVGSSNGQVDPRLGLSSQQATSQNQIRSELQQIFAGNGQQPPQAERYQNQEEYLVNWQKQGLVENILNSYHRQGVAQAH
jgi:hypothetical protein